MADKMRIGEDNDHYFTLIRPDDTEVLVGKDPDTVARFYKPIVDHPDYEGPVRGAEKTVTDPGTIPDQISLPEKTKADPLTASTNTAAAMPKIVEDDPNSDTFLIQKADGSSQRVPRNEQTAPLYRQLKNQTTQSSAVAPPATAPTQAKTPPSSEVSQEGNVATDVGAGGMGMPPQMGEKTSEKTTEKIASPQTQADLREMDRLGKSIATDEQKAGELARQVTIKRAEAQANLLSDQVAQQEQVKLNRQMEFERRQQEINAVESKFKGMSLDGSRFFGSDITGSKVMGAIGLAFGALGQAYNGQENTAYKMIKDAIDRDIEVQRINMDKAGKNVEMARGGLKDYMNVTKDLQTAIALETATKLEGVAKQFEAIQASNSGAAVNAAAKKTQLTILQKTAELRANATGKVVEKSTESVPSKPQETPLDVRDKVIRNTGTIAKLQRFENLMDAVTTGPVAGRMIRIKNALGAQTDDEQELRQIAQSLTADLGHSLSGSSAFSKAEWPKFEDMGIDFNNRKDVLKKDIQRFRMQAQQELEQSSAFERQAGRNLDIPYYQGLADKQYPGSAKRSNSFKKAK